MAAVSVTDVIWRLNLATKEVEIIHDGRILETCDVRIAALRLSHHRHEVAKASGRRLVETSPYKRQGRRS